ncbi:MAG TPA: PQQ-binding-like beta-propeller repeat protein [Planctomycetota bacterium]|nr:PQQ-binding-like beta-propeller repeat protein [Planctomycetota bacterium]
MTKWAALIAVLMLAASGANAGQAVASLDWPQWRGPNRDDVSTETGLLKKWPEGGPKLLWTAKGLGSGFSGLAIVGDKMFTMGDVDGSSHVIALNVKDGSGLWKTKIGKPGGSMGAGGRSTPTVDGNFVYALGQFAELGCFQAADGKEVWSKNLMTDFGGQMAKMNWQYSESVLIDGNLLLCTPGGPQGTMLALDKKTGAKVWQTSEITDPAHYSSIIAADIGGVHQYIQLTAAHVFGVDAKSGKVLWSAPRKGATAVIPTPIYYDNYVFVTSGYGIGDNCFKIDSTGGTFKVEQVYAGKDIIDHHGGVVRVGEYIYGHSDSGGWTCLEMKTGKVKWQNNGVGKGSCTYADGHLYCRSEGPKGTIALVEATPEAYKEDGRFDQPNRTKSQSWTHPVICGGKMYIRDQDMLLCYDVKA